MQIYVYALAMHKHRFAQNAEPVVARLARQSPISLASKTKGLSTMPTVKLNLWSLYQMLWGWGFVVFFSWTSFPNSTKPQHWKKWTQEVMRLPSLFGLFAKYYPVYFFQAYHTCIIKDMQWTITQLHGCYCTPLFELVFLRWCSS